MSKKNMQTINKNHICLFIFGKCVFKSKMEYRTKNLKNIFSSLGSKSNFKNTTYTCKN